MHSIQPYFINVIISHFQVICWFQNRRAKFKRDMEELKKDVEKSPLDPRQNIPRPNLPMPVSLHHPIPTSLPLPSIPHPLLCLAPHLLPVSIASQCRSPMGSPDACSPPIRVEDSDWSSDEIWQRDCISASPCCGEMIAEIGLISRTGNYLQTFLTVQ